MGYWSSLEVLAQEEKVEWEKLTKNQRHWLMSEYVRSNGWRVAMEGVPDSLDYQLTEVIADMMEVRHFGTGEQFLDTARKVAATLYAILLNEVEPVVQLQYDNEVPDPEAEAFMISMNRGRV